MPKFNSKILFLSLLFLLTLSCFPARKLRPPSEELTASKVLKELSKKEESIESMACLVDLKMTSPEDKFSATVEIFYTKPDHYAFYVRAFLGTNYLNGVLKEDRLFLYFPQDNKYYQGRFSRLRQRKFWRWGIEIKDLLNIIMGKNGFENNESLFLWREKKEYVYLTEDEKWKKTFFVNFKNSKITRGYWTKKRTEEVYQLKFRDYKKYSDYELPRSIEITESSNTEKIKIKFKDRKINLQLPDKKFQIKIPPDAERIGFEKEK